MAYRLYIAPAIGAGTMTNPRRPKYFTGLPYAAFDYGFQPLFLVASDLSVADDAAIVANADVFAFPFNLAPNLTNNQVTSASTAFETAFIPAQWVNASQTWRQVARTVAGMFQFMQRLHGVLGSVIVIDQSTKLNVQFNSLDPVIRQGILDAAASLGYSTNIAGNTQLRQVLKDLADQWGEKEFIFDRFVL